MNASAEQRPGVAILVGGSLAATFDMIYAIVVSGMHGRSAQWVMQSVASGLMGNAAFESGATGAVVGTVAHYVIVFVAATLYYLASRRLPVLRTHAIACGILFGVLVYLFMNFVVLPLSAFPFDLSYPVSRLVQGFVSHGLLVGLPIALAVKWFSAPVVGRSQARAA
jgi:uncharacterized membrane protein